MSRLFLSINIEDGNVWTEGDLIVATRTHPGVRSPVPAALRVQLALSLLGPDQVWCVHVVRAGVLGRLQGQRAREDWMVFTHCREFLM
jgi:hypothetical protein|eukprot:SAG25_NODE_3_length_30426_cov_8.268210_34_plen_88_part_00